MENRTAASGGDLLEAKRKYAVTTPDLAEIMLYVKAAENGDYDTEENLNNKEYRSAYEKYLKEAESRNEPAVSMNMFLNTVLPVQTQIQKNRDNAYTDFFDGFKTAHEILKEQLDYINDALPWASLAAIAAVPAAAPVTAPMAVSIAAYLEFIEVCSNTMAAAADLIEKLLTDNLLEEETSLSTYEDELYNVFGNLLYMAESIIGRKSGSALKVSRELYAALEKNGVNEVKKEVSEAGGKILKKELADVAKEAVKKTSISDKIINIAKQIKANNGTPPKGYKGGRTYKNMPSENEAQKLPEGINYKEYDVNPYIKGQNRGTERIVIGDNGSVWYTNDHYYTFTQIE